MNTRKRKQIKMSSSNDRVFLDFSKELIKGMISATDHEMTMVCEKLSCMVENHLYRKPLEYCIHFLREFNGPISIHAYFIGESTPKSIRMAIIEDKVLFEEIDMLALGDTISEWYDGSEVEQPAQWECIRMLEEKKIEYILEALQEYNYKRIKIQPDQIASPKNEA